MAMGRRKDRQGGLLVSWSETPRSPGHVFYHRLQSVPIEGGFDGFAETVCRRFYAARMGASSVPPGRTFRMHLVGYFEGIDSKRGLEWRGSDSLSLREFLRLASRVPDHSWLSRTRTAEDLVRQRIGAGTPREAVARGYGGIFVPLTPTGAKAVALAVSESGQTAFAAAFLIRPRFLIWE